MMATHGSDVMDPMYNFDTHFPERLSRLHVHGDTFAPPQNNFRKKKTRANRNAARYKTQPVTFDEILEVDEEPGIPTSASACSGMKDVNKRRSTDDRLLNMNQLQAFSKSLDGLVPVKPLPEHFKHNVITLGRSGSFSRSGSRKYHRHPECIPEKAESESQPKSPTVQQQQTSLVHSETGEQRLSDVSKVSGVGETCSRSGQQSSTLTVEGVDSRPVGATVSPVPSPNIAARRQKMTAKAKKRQKAQDEGDGS